MKLRIFLLVAGLAIAGGLSSCKKHVTGTTRMGKLVVTAGCGHSIVELLDITAADSSIVTRNWTDPDNDSTYTNVFGVSDICEFAAANVQVGDTFSFTLNGPVPNEICNTCDILPFPMPAASNSVTNVSIQH